MKTAEEILNSYLGEVNKELFKRCVEPAMREFAAQEVAREIEEYKLKLKNEIAQLPLGLETSKDEWSKGWSKGLYDVIKVIDTVK